MILFLSGETIQETLSGKLLFFQFVPTLVSFFQGVTLFSLGCILILVITSIFGRVYCSVLCPLGITFDLVRRLSQFRFFHKPRRKYAPPWTKTRNTILTVTVFSMFIGSLGFLNLLDPYSLFGRMITNLVRPIQIRLQNLSVKWLESNDFYVLSLAEPFQISTTIMWITLAITFTLVFLAYKYGRIYCNSICPVGTLLGFISRYSIGSFRIIPDSCNKCGRCETVCKSDCIESKYHRIDLSRCVACFNCLNVCSDQAISYEIDGLKRAASGVNFQRRHFLTRALMVTGGISFLKWSDQTTIVPRIPGTNLSVITPPGSIDNERYSSTCTACHLCVDACPRRVIQPKPAAFDMKGVFQPVMDFQSGYCENECNLCGKVCPTGAIKPLVLEEKQKTKIGDIGFWKDRCVVYKRREKCVFCIEICPTKAITPLVIDGLKHPVVDANLCIGCGACQFVCPTLPKSFIVKPLTQHVMIDLTEPLKDQDDDELDDFLKHLELDEESAG